MSEKKFENNKQKLLTVLVTVILVVFFIGGFWIGLDRVRSMEGTFPPNDIKEGISAAPETPADAALYLEKVIEKALAEKPKLSSDDNFSIDSDSVNTDGSETFKATLLFAKDNFKNYISSVEDTEDEITEVNFGEDISSLLPCRRNGAIRPGACLGRRILAHRKFPHTGLSNLRRQQQSFRKSRQEASVSGSGLRNLRR